MNQKERTNSSPLRVQELCESRGGRPRLLLHCCLTSTEARWLIRDGDRVGRGRQSEGSTAETARKRPERPWTAARTMEVLRRCPFAIAQWLVHCAIAVSTAVLGQSQRQCPLHCCWWTAWTTRNKRGPACSAQLHLHTYDLFWANLKVQLHLPPLRSLDLLISPGTLSWDFRPNEPYGYRERKAILNHAHALVSACPWYVKRYPRTWSNTTAT